MFAKLCMVFCFLSSLSLEVFVTKGTLRPIVFSLEIADLTQEGEGFADQTREVAVQDLVKSGMFVIKPATQKATEIFTKFDLDALRAQEIKITAGCVVDKCDQDGCIVKMRIVHDTGAEPEIIDIRFNCKLEDLRLLAHQIANAIYQMAWSIPGDFDSQIVYVNRDRGGSTLVLMDRDGSNSKVLDQAKIISTPTVSKDGSKIIYAKHVQHYHCLFMYDRQNKKIIQLTQPGKIAYSPVFSNDSKFIVFSLSEKGSTSLYKLNLETRKLTCLTNAKRWIDTTPAFTASGKELIMISDRRAGTPKPYIYHLDSGNVQEIQTASGAYYDPACCNNPFNKTITQMCFFKRKGGMAYLGMLLLDSEFNTMQERLLWQGPRLYAPSWGVNGTSIIFNTLNQLKRINIFTGATEVLTTFGKPNTAVVSVRPSWEQSVYSVVM